MRGLDNVDLDFVIFDATKCSLRMGGNIYEGRFSADGRLLWKDGSMWVRKRSSGEESAPQVVAAGEGQEQAPQGAGEGQEQAPQGGSGEPSTGTNRATARPNQALAGDVAGGAGGGAGAADVR